MNAGTPTDLISMQQAARLKPSPRGKNGTATGTVIRLILEGKVWGTRIGFYWFTSESLWLAYLNREHRKEKPPQISLRAERAQRRITARELARHGITLPARKELSA